MYTKHVLRIRGTRGGVSWGAAVRPLAQNSNRDLCENIYIMKVPILRSEFEQAKQNNFDLKQNKAPGTDDITE